MGDITCPRQAKRHCTPDATHQMPGRPEPAGRAPSGERASMQGQTDESGGGVAQGDRSHLGETTRCLRHPIKQADIRCPGAKMIEWTGLQETQATRYWPTGKHMGRQAGRVKHTPWGPPAATGRARVRMTQPAPWALTRNPAPLCSALWAAGQMSKRNRGSTRPWAAALSAPRARTSRRQRAVE
jgi:hypothetical protein